MCRLEQARGEIEKQVLLADVLYGQPLWVGTG